MAPFERKLRVWLQVVIWVGIGVAPLAAQQAISLVGSGSSVPSPLYSAWAEQYGKLKPGVQVRYLQLGASEGVRQISQGVGDFAAGEIPLTDTQMHKGENSLVQFPTVLVAIVPIYKLPGEPELRFSGELLADIFLGNVTNWKDARKSDIRYVQNPRPVRRSAWTYAFVAFENWWRRGRDSNPRDPFGPNGFQDRRFQPLTHPSFFNYNQLLHLVG